MIPICIFIWEFLFSPKSAVYFLRHVFVVLSHSLSNVLMNNLAFKMFFLSLHNVVAVIMQPLPLWDE